MYIFGVYLINAANQKYRQSAKGKIAYKQSMNRYYHKLRYRMITILGGKCVKCGVRDNRVLQVDHINGGGNKEFKKRGNMGVYLKILKNQEGYQLLCANCNQIKKYENHENKKTVYNYLYEGKAILT